MVTETRHQYEDGYEYIGYAIIENGATVGYATVMTDEKSAYCERIDIEPEYRGRGYGTSALRDLSSMYGGIIIAPDNEDARRLYERIGSECSDDMYDQGFGVYEI